MLKLVEPNQAYGYGSAKCVVEKEELKIYDCRKLDIKQLYVFVSATCTSVIDKMSVLHICELYSSHHQPCHMKSIVLIACSIFHPKKKLNKRRYKNDPLNPKA